MTTNNFDKFQTNIIMGASHHDTSTQKEFIKRFTIPAKFDCHMVLSWSAVVRDECIAK